MWGHLVTKKTMHIMQVLVCTLTSLDICDQICRAYAELPYYYAGNPSKAATAVIKLLYSEALQQWKMPLRYCSKLLKTCRQVVNWDLF